MRSSIGISRRHPSSAQSSCKSIVPLYEACRDGDEKRVRSLVPKYSVSDLNQQEPLSGNTCLHIAAKNSHDNVVRILLKYGCYRSSILNFQNQSAYDVAASSKQSMRLLFHRLDTNQSSSVSSKYSSRFLEQDATKCFGIIKIEDNDDIGTRSSTGRLRPVLQIFKTEKEKKHEIEYSASSKSWCQSSLGRFCVNFFHTDQPLSHDTVLKRLKAILKQINDDTSEDYIKVDNLMKQYEKNCDSIEQLLHLYTLETEFYRVLKQDCLPLAIPLFIHLPKLKERFFKGRVYRGSHMTYDQLSIYEAAMKTPGTILQTRSFSSTSTNRSVAEEFAHSKAKRNKAPFFVLIIIDFPSPCDQAINLSRISTDIPCLSEYEDEEEVLVLPWTLFEVKYVKSASNTDNLVTIHLINTIIPTKNILSTLKWSCVEFKKILIKEGKCQFDCAFQKYNMATGKMQ